MDVRHNGLRYRDERNERGLRLPDLRASGSLFTLDIGRILCRRAPRILELEPAPPAGLEGGGVES